MAHSLGHSPVSQVGGGEGEGQEERKAGLTGSFPEAQGLVHIRRAFCKPKPWVGVSLGFYLPNEEGMLQGAREEDETAPGGTSSPNTDGSAKLSHLDTVPFLVPSPGCSRRHAS